MENFISLQNVSKIYQSNSLSNTALKNISLDIHKGEFVILAGPSGSGKTTLLNLIGGLDKPTQGKIQSGENDLSQMDKTKLAIYRLKNVGFIFQSLNLISVLTALENVEYVLLLQGVPQIERRNRAAFLLNRVGLGNYLQSLPSQMSGGEQQRVAVARALATNPTLVLADEPTANLDSKTGLDLITLFRELGKSYHTTFIIASHDPMVIKKAGRVVWLHDGEIAK